MKTYSVYTLKCCDDSFYTGVTDNLYRRLAEHNEGLYPFCYTVKRRPLELVFVQEYQEIKEAIAFEKQVKGWSRRKKLAMINDEWDKLKELAECKNETSHKNLKGNLEISKPDEESSHV